MSLSLSGRLALGGVVAVALAGAAGAADSLATNLDRLGQFPLARRQVLWANLQRFDALPRDQRAAIRQLDQELAALPDAEQVRYRRVLHRYHLWVRSLSDETREKLQKADPSARMELVRRTLAETPPPPWEKLDRLLYLGSTLHSTPVFEQAFAISSWLALDEEGRKQLAKLPAAQRITRLLELGERNGVPDPRPLGVRKAEDRVREKVRENFKRFDQFKAPQKVAAVRRLAEAFFLDRHETAAVEPARLARFTAALPGWLLQGLDELPAGVAHRRLETLYRLVYGDGEIPEPEPKAASPAGKTPEAARPATDAAPPATPL